MNETSVLDCVRNIEGKGEEGMIVEGQIHDRYYYRSLVSLFNHLNKGLA